MNPPTRPPPRPGRTGVLPMEVIDPTGRRRRDIGRRVRRVVLPIVGVTIVVAAMAGVGWRSYDIARQSITRLSRAVLVATQNSIAQEVATYLVPATQGQAIGLDMVQHGALVSGQASFQRFANALMRQDPQVAAFYLANSDGDFELVQRAADGGTDTVLVTDKTPGHVRLRSETRLDENGQVTAREPDRPSTYDPRQSDYFQGAMRRRVDHGATSVLPDGSTVYWSSPYLLRSTDTPVITASIGYTDPGDRREHVLAVNLALDRLSGFLGRLKIGAHGQAMILERRGQIVAAPQLAQAKDDPSAWRLDHGATDPRLADSTAMVRAFDLFRVQGFGPQGFDLHGTPYISLAARLPGASPDWVLLLVEPARDFAAFSAADTRSTFISLLVILVLAAALAGILIWQGVRTDRLVDQLGARNARGLAEREALHALLGQPDLLDPAVEVPGLTERLAQAAGAARAGIWRLVHEASTLRCDDLYDARHDTHAGGAEILLEDEGDFVDARARDSGFSVADAAADPRTRRYYRQAMRGADTTRLDVVVVPGTNGPGTNGPGTNGPAALLLIEDGIRTADSDGLIDMIAGIVALRAHVETAPRTTNPPGAATRDTDYDAATRGTDHDAATRGTGDPVPPAPHAETGAPHPLADASGDDLLLDASDDDLLRSGLFPAVAVMVMTFGDTGVEYVADVEGSLRLVSEIATGLQAIARRYGLFSVKVAGHRMVASAGCTPTADTDAAVRLALAALAMRDLCRSRLSAADVDPSFQIGLDVGPTFGARVGESPRVFNLWGETMRIAEAMAQSNPQPGSIQVTEAMYGLLRERFLFRSRGNFYTPRRGVARAYILAGRQ